MKILFISYCDPTKIKTGDNIYTLNILSNLKAIHADVHFLSFNDKDLEISNNNVLNRYCRKITFIPFTHMSKIKLVLSNYPASIKSRKNPLMIYTVQVVLNSDDYDFVMVNHFKMSYVLEFVNKLNFKSVFISHNVESILSESLYRFTKNPIKFFLFYQEYLKVKFYERKYLMGYDIITGISDFDVNYFKNQFKNKKTYLLPAVVKNESMPFKTGSDQKKVILCGSFFWEPKIENLMRLLNAKNFKKLYEKGIKLIIVGNAPPELVEKINREYIGVEMTGYVLNTFDYYHNAKIALVPELLGGGFKLKIAEAISFNRPIIALRESITDYDMKDGIHFLRANTFEEIIESTIDLIQNEEKMNFLSKNALNLFREKYSEKAIQKGLLDILSITKLY